MLYTRSIEEGQEDRQSATMMTRNAQEIHSVGRRNLVDNDELSPRPPEMTKCRPPRELTFDPKQVVHRADSTSRTQASACSSCDSTSRGQAPPTPAKGGKKGTERDEIEFNIRFSPTACGPNVNTKLTTTKMSIQGGASTPPAEFKLDFAKEPSQAGGHEPEQEPVDYDEPEAKGLEFVLPASNSKKVESPSQQAKQRSDVVHGNKRLDISFANPSSNGGMDNNKTMREEFVLPMRHQRKGLSGPPRTIVRADALTSSIMSEVTLSGHFEEGS